MVLPERICPVCLTSENARLRAEVEEVRAALLRYYEMSRTRPESVSTADIARMARKEVEALRIMVDQFLSERDTALADLARVTAERDGLAHGLRLLRSKYQSQREAGADVTRLDGLLSDVSACTPLAKEGE
jgi:hypothetical protein